MWLEQPVHLTLKTSRSFTTLLESSTDDRWGLFAPRHGMAHVSLVSSAQLAANTYTHTYFVHIAQFHSSLIPICPVRDREETGAERERGVGSRQTIQNNNKIAQLSIFLSASLHVCLSFFSSVRSCR